MPSVCAKCSHVYVATSGDRTRWKSWLCFKRPRPAEFNHVTGECVADPPYAYCRYVNDGNCELFEEGPNQLQPKGIPIDEQ